MILFLVAVKSLMPVSGVLQMDHGGGGEDKTENSGGEEGVGEGGVENREERHGGRKKAGEGGKAGRKKENKETKKCFWFC